MYEFDRQRITKLSGFGMTQSSDAYLYRPTSEDQIRELLSLARQQGRKVTLRGSARSYGDAPNGSESLCIDICRMNRVIDWNPDSGLITCESGATIETLWRTGIEDGWWPPIVSGTMAPTLAGALGMNIHGKNNFKAGPLGNHVTSLDVMWADGRVETLEPSNPLFFAVISGAGLLGVILRVTIKMSKISTGNLRVLAVSPRDWDQQFELFEKYEGDADYMVSWVDCFGRGDQSGRGQFHAGWYLQSDEADYRSLLIDSQDLPDSIMGLVPKSVVWRFLKPLNNRFGMRFLNAAKHHAGAILGNHKTVTQSLVAFSFLLDYVPNWRNAYLPGGFIQYQSFVPKESAKHVFAAQIQLQQEYRLESFLGVMKRHKQDRFLLTNSVDGYSLALDFKVTTGNKNRLISLCHKMNDLVLSHGGRFYLAKDSTLRKQDLEQYLGPALNEFKALKQELDPECLFVTDQARRIGLI